MAAHLSYGRVNLNVLREAVRRELREFLDKCAGSKAIVWDEYLTGPFGLIAQYSLLKEHEVEKMFTLKGSRLPAADVKNIIFFVRPRLELMDIIAENVLSEDRRGPARDFHILFVPRRSLLCEQRLKDLGVLGSFIHREEYSLDLIPFDGDLLSMESESAFKECYLESDQTSLYHAAKGLMTLQALYGTIPQIFGKGECARQVANMMIRMKREFTGSQNSIFPVFDNLLLLDRNVDLLTPLATQLTYEGLIDEIYGIQNSYVKLPPEKFTPKKQGDSGKDLPTEAKKLQLNSAEELYAEIRDKNFNAVGSVLSKKAKVISAAFEERHNAKTVGEIKQFVSQLPHMQAARGSLANHTSIAELIKDVTTSEDFFDKLTVEQEFMSGIDTDKVNNYIEDCIAQKHPLIKVLRLVCLQSVCNSGLKQKVLDYYKREILQVTTNVLWSRCFCLFWIFHTSGIIQRVSFFVCLLLHGVIFSRFIRVMACITTSLLFMAEKYSILHCLDFGNLPWRKNQMDLLEVLFIENSGNPLPDLTSRPLSCRPTAMNTY
ncbi:vacuolar protein sorting-associated protein 33A isoform X3 [Elephas maximus indicus]|uniref:vacuolar protein sorting-associated protein 33A isoform X3 n=1 Tax=Elephas maximus indicus TaxID=99487 RepID=UPI00211664E6|nr:vacuolar protein sorting-associated protein 33A isoform X3 [Elephas maximus indicus]